MEAVTLARPYARAAFQLAQEGGSVADWSTHLATAAAIAGDSRMAGLGNDPRIGTAELARLYRPEDVANGSPFARFLDVMADSRRLPLLPEVARHFARMRHAAERTVQVRLRCAEQPPQAQLDALVEALRERLRRNVELEIEVQPEMLGGAIIDVDGEVIDGSVTARLQRLQAALMH